MHRLAHYESFETREAALRRARAMNTWRRLWRLELIERFNPGWRDLAPELPLECSTFRFRGDERRFGVGSQPAAATPGP